MVSAVLLAAIVAFVVIALLFTEGLTSHGREANERAAANADEQARSLSEALAGLPPGSPITREAVVQAARVRTAAVLGFTEDRGRVTTLVEVHGVTSGPIGGVEAVKCFRLFVDPAPKRMAIRYTEVAGNDCTRAESESTIVSTS